MGRPQEHDDSTRVKLLEAAETLIGDGGPKALSVRAVAEQIGTSTRAVYSVFGGKDGLLQALVAQTFASLGALVDGLPVTDDPSADLVRAGVDGFRRFAVEHPNLFRLAFERLAADLAPSPEGIAATRASLRALRTRVQHCDRDGLLGGRDPEHVTWQFHALCQGLASVELQGWLPARTRAEFLWRDALEAFVRGCADPPREAPVARCAGYPSMDDSA